jgi:uroporphyrinogen-III synthase
MTTLYLGLRPPPNFDGIHYPVIQIIPLHPELPRVSPFTHLIFTSRTAVELFPLEPGNLRILSVGRATTAAIEQRGWHTALTAIDECAEGIIELLDQEDLANANILWPHSKRSRSLIADTLKKRGIRYHDAALYDTVANQPGPPPNLNEIDTIIFTSPSTVDGFLAIYGCFPEGKQLETIGPITRSHLASRDSELQNPS